MTEHPPKRTYEEVVADLSPDDAVIIEGERNRLNKEISGLKNAASQLSAVVLEYHNNISVLNANSERILSTLNPKRKTR